MPFLPGTGTALMDETLELTAEAQRSAPRPRSSSRRTTARAQQEGLFEWYCARRVASSPTCRSSSTTCPIRAAVDIAPETVGRLRRAHDNIVGIKETTRDFEHVSYVLDECGTDFIALSGIELLCYPMLTLGGAGHLSCVGELRAGAGRASSTTRSSPGDHERARRAALRAAPARRRGVRRDQPGAGEVGHGAARPAGSGHAREPLAPLSATGQDKVRALLATSPHVDLPVARSA